MPPEPHDPRDIPILTDAVKEVEPASLSVEAKAVHAAILTETLELADSLLHQAVKDIEATLFERVLDRLRARLPELVDRILARARRGTERSSKPWIKPSRRPRSSRESTPAGRRRDILLRAAGDLAIDRHSPAERDRHLAHGPRISRHDHGCA